MKRMRTNIVLAISAVVLFAAGTSVLRYSTRVAAQSSHQGLQTIQRDILTPGWMRREIQGSGDMRGSMRQRMARHWAFMHQGIPAEYRDARNPYSPSAKTIGQGRVLYQDNCAPCHGATGMNDSEAANTLNPPPALLAYLIRTPMAVDEYMLWSISEGGKAFGTEMPTFKDDLTRDEIWKIVTYMRAGFPTE